MEKAYTRLLVILGIVCIGLFGCKSADNASLSEALDSESEVNFLTIPLMKATAEDIQDHVVECHGKGQQICIQICHVPPGNPDNRHDKVLPLKAALKHLDHGGPNHVEKDYLGLCYPVSDPDDSSGDDSSGDDSSGDDSSGDDGSGDDGSGDDTLPGDGDDSNLPEYCLENIDYDADCDGIVDATGEPIYFLPGNEM